MYLDPRFVGLFWINDDSVPAGAFIVERFFRAAEDLP